MLRRSTLHLLLGLLGVLCGYPLPIHAQDAAPTWDKDAGPVFRKYCMPCHDRANRTAGLVLESYAGLMKGGAHGPVIVAGKSDESRLVLLTEGKEQPRMPPAGKAPSKSEIARLRAWIDAGARPGPKESTIAPRSTAPTLAGSPEPRPRVPVSGQIASLAFAPAPGSRWLAAGGYREVLLLDATTARVVARLPGPVATVTSVAFSPNGRLLAAAGGAPGQFGEIVLWQIGPSPPRRLRVLRGHRDAIYSVAFSPDGQTLAAGSYDRMVSLWPLSTRGPTGVADGRPPGGRAADGGRRVDPRTPVPLAGGAPRMLKDHIDAVYALAFSPDGRRLASASGDRTVKVWDVQSGKRLFTLSEPTAELYAVAFHPSGRELAAGGADKMLRTWTLGNDAGTLARSAFAHDGALVRIRYTPDGRHIFTSGEDRAVKAWAAGRLTEPRVLETQPDWPLALDVSPDGRRVAVGRYDGSVAIYDSASGRRLAALGASDRRPPTLRAGIRTADRPPPGADSASRRGARVLHKVTR